MLNFPYTDYTLDLVKEAVLKLGYTEEIFHFIKQPAFEYRYHLPVKMDDGSYKMFSGFRLQHNLAAGPTMGALRFHQAFDLEEVSTAALWQSMACGLINLPFGGAVGGVHCDPRSLSNNELEAVSRKYIEACFPVISKHRDVIGGSATTSPQMIGWLFDEYSKLGGVNPYQSFTGKPFVLGGFEYAEEMSAFAVACCIEEAMQHKGQSLDQLRVTVQGFGQMGSYVAKYLHDRGAIIVGISDIYGALYDEFGLDIDYLIDRRDSFGTVTTMFEHTITNTELLTKHCDMLILTSAADQITALQAQSIQATMIAEVAMKSISEEASNIFREMGAFVIPDLLLNLGTPIVTYVEWSQGNKGIPIDLVESLIREKISSAFIRVYELSVARQITLRLAAYMVGLRQLLETIRVRGWIT